MAILAQPRKELEIYDQLGGEVHPAYGKKAGLVSAVDVANRLHDQIQGKKVVVTGCGLASLGAELAWTVGHHRPSS